MKTAGDCEVVVLPKNRGGAVCRMSADAYATELQPRSAVCSRSVPAPAVVVEPRAWWWDRDATGHLEGPSAILSGGSPMSLEHWAVWAGIFAALAVLIRLELVRHRGSPSLTVSIEEMRASPWFPPAPFLVTPLASMR
jgi:hypothetical protein